MLDDIEEKNREFLKSELGIRYYYYFQNLEPVIPTTPQPSTTTPWWPTKWNFANETHFKKNNTLRVRTL